ncbi:MAG: cytochrome subunit of sulfide dehydrogenase domain protein [Pseudomonadota bacterium]|jgi:cytochrome c553
MTHSFAALLGTGTLLLSLHVPAQAQAADPNLARNLAATCANCHGTDGQARGDAAALAGMSEQRLLNTLTLYRNGTLPATIMHQITKGYTEDQLKLIAGYFAAQKPRQ